MSSEKKHDPSAHHSGSLIQRGTSTFSPLSITLFIGLRSLDPLLQYSILAHGYGSTLVRKLGGTILPPGPVANTGIALIDGLGLSTYRLSVLAMVAAGALKQSYWAVAIGNETMSAGTAVEVSVFNSIFDGVASLLAITAATSGDPHNPLSTNANNALSTFRFNTGVALFTIGVVTELVSELQRQAFKRDPKNKGKVYSGGLWSLARHVNYGGYTLWRTGLAIASSGWVFGGTMAAFFTAQFWRSSIPEIDGYCADRYGEQWTQFKKKVPYRLFPWIV